jgi:hypothetical protein
VRSRGRRGARGTRFGAICVTQRQSGTSRARAGQQSSPFKDYVVERLTSAAPERIPASMLLPELRERGYTGGYTMLKVLVASLKPRKQRLQSFVLRPSRANRCRSTGRLFRAAATDSRCLSATLGWSRASYVEFATDERAETLIEAHENAFLAFGGTPREAGALIPSVPVNGEQRKTITSAITQTHPSISWAIFRRHRPKHDSRTPAYWMYKPHRT